MSSSESSEIGPIASSSFPFSSSETSFPESSSVSTFPSSSESSSSFVVPVSSSSSTANESFQVEEVQITPPVISPAQNGTGETFQKVIRCNSFGKTISVTDYRGVTTLYQYDLATGAVIRRIDAAAPPVGSLGLMEDASPLNLVTDFVVDSLGRVLKELGPPHEVQLEDCDTTTTEIRTVRFTVYLDSVHEERGCQGYARGNAPEYDFYTVGPVKITRKDEGGRIVDEIEAKRHCESGALSATEKFPQEKWTKWSHQIYDIWGRLRATRVYFKIPENGQGFKNENYYETRFDYDSMGRQVRQVNAGGTITRTVFDVLGRRIEEWVGTNDIGATNSDPSGGGASGNNMVRVVALEYDYGQPDGNGLVTKETRYVTREPDPDVDRVTEYSYSARDLLEVTKTIDGTTTFHEVREYDNLDRQISITKYKIFVALPNRIAHATSEYDDLGRVFRETVYAVNQTTGALGTALITERWFDADGNIVKLVEPGKDVYQKFAYDALGRRVVRYLCYPFIEESSSSSSESSSSSSPSSSSSTSSESSESLSSSSSSPSSTSSSYSSDTSFSFSSRQTVPPSSLSSSSSSSSSSPSQSTIYHASSTSSFLPSSSSTPTSSSSTETSSSSTSSRDSNFSSFSSSSTSSESTSSVSFSDSESNSGGSAPSIGDCPTCGECAACSGLDLEEESVCTGEDYSSYPIRYANGQIELSETDLSNSGFGLPWGQTRSYGNLLSGAGSNGYGWTAWQFAQLWFDMGYAGDNVMVFRSANANLWFAPDGLGGYVGRFATRFQLHHDLGVQKFVLTSPDGVQQVFNDNNPGYVAEMRGRLMQVIDAFGNVTNVIYNGVYKMVSFERAGETSSAGFSYVYVNTGPNEGLLASVTLTVNGALVRRVMYDYYLDGAVGGSAKDLKQAVIEQYDSTSGTWSRIRHTFYRYYLDSSGTGFRHGLQFVLGGAAYQEMVNVGLDPESVSEGQMTAYADMQFSYDVVHRVVLESVRGGQMTFEFSYLENSTSPEPDEHNVWNMRTIETRPDGSTKTVYTNRAGRVILRILAKASDPEVSYAYFIYNDAGRIVQKITTAAISSIVEPTIGSPSLTVNLRADAGLIREFDYYEDSNPLSGAVLSYLKSRFVKSGEEGTAFKLTQAGYSTHTAKGVSIHPIQFRAEYTNPDSPVEDAPKTSYSMAYY